MLGFRVGNEFVDCHGHRNAELPDVSNMAAKIFATGRNRLYVFFLEVALRDAAVHLERFGGRNQDYGIRMKFGLATFDIEKLLCAKIGAEACFCHDIVGEFQRRFCRDDGIAAVRYVGERTAVHEAGIVFQCLYEIRLKRVAE